MRFVLLTCLALATSIAFAPSAPGQESNRLGDIAALQGQLLEGVESVHKPGAPAAICAIGEESFPIYLGRDNAGHALPVVAGSLFGEGRVVLFGHGGYFSQKEFESEDHDSGQLVLNVLRWLGNSDRNPRPRVGVFRNPKLVEALGERRIRAESVTWSSAFSGDFDVLVHGNNDWGGERHVDEMIEFVRRGGGFLGAGLRWGWEQLNPGKDPFVDFDANVFALRAGLAFGIGTLRTIGPRIDDRDLLRFDTQARHAAESLFAPTTGESDPNRSAQWGKVVVTAVRSLDPGSLSSSNDEGGGFLARLCDRAEQFRGAPPTPDAPLDSKAPHRRVAWTIADLIERSRDPEDVRAMPGSEEFPGTPLGDAAPQTIRTQVSMDRPGWTGTGIWIPAGRPVRVEMRPNPPEGLAFRIGCHTDRLWGKDSWSRHPDISLRIDVADSSTTFATPYGGLLFFDHKKDLDQEFQIVVEGGVRAPRFERGAGNSNWNDPEETPGPWAELVGENFAMCVPSEHIRSLENPEELMAFWDEAVSWYEELDRRPVYVRKERFVTDVQISAGYMHSGYPIMTHLDVAPVLVDLEKSRTGSHGGVWGFWHELGHNRQLPTWTFGGTGEVTNNLFALFVIERHQGLAPGEQKQIKNNRRKILSYLREPDFAVWKKQPFTALAMYVELQEEFGWEAFQRVFQGYLDSERSELPKADPEKRDQWMVRFSREVQRDLSPFFVRWGVPVSESAVESLDGLEPWDGR